MIILFCGLLVMLGLEFIQLKSLKRHYLNMSNLYDNTTIFLSACFSLLYYTNDYKISFTLRVAITLLLTVFFYRGFT